MKAINFKMSDTEYKILCFLKDIEYRTASDLIRWLLLSKIRYYALNYKDVWDNLDDDIIDYLIKHISDNDKLKIKSLYNNK